MIREYRDMRIGCHKIQLLIPYRKNKKRAVEAAITVSKSQIEFTKSPFALKTEIKAMAGAKWHGFDYENPRPVWTASNTDRNWFQLRRLMGEDVYQWFNRPRQEFNSRHPLLPHQIDMVNGCMTYHYHMLAGWMGTGKTLAAIATMELSGIKNWVWIGPPRSRENIANEFQKWNIDSSIQVTFTTPESLHKLVAGYRKGELLPQGMIVDESMCYKNYSSKRSTMGATFASMIRARFGYEGFVILMCGSPAPKSPIDWWSQAEIIWPGYLLEGSVKAFEERMAVMGTVKKDDGQFRARITWKDDPEKCMVCGELKEGHSLDHSHVPSKDEVGFLCKRLKSLITVVSVDCLNLPDKIYVIDQCIPSRSLLRAAKAIYNAADTPISALTDLRALSDGFQYRMEQQGTEYCKTCKGEGQIISYDDDAAQFYVPCPLCDGTLQAPHMVRVALEVPTPKEPALRVRLQECHEHGRVVCFAGFTASVDRVAHICRDEGWTTIRCDSRGWQVKDMKGDSIDCAGKPLAFWDGLERNRRVAFVANQMSGGVSLNLQAARMAIYWSNDFNPNSRTQSEGRIHRLGMDMNIGCKIVDLYNLPVDEYVHNILKSNRKMELLTLGDIEQALKIELEEHTTWRC